MNRIIAILAVALLPLGVLEAQSEVQAFKPKIVVTGYAEQKVQPDIINVNLTFGENKEFFGKQNIEDLEQKVIAVLKNNGLDIKKDISVISNSNYSSDNKVLIRKTVVFSVSDYAKYYAIARQMDFKGIQSMRITSIKYSKEDEVKKALLPKALSNARDMANAILNGSGASIYDILYVNAQNIRVSNNSNYDDMITVGYSMARKSNTDYEYMEKSQDITISVSMDVWFGLFNTANQQKMNN
ncbi:MAG: SIMPL domain-containing protein [Flavobacteriales bacterium]|nr:SIMPL domain-containing protein [Flavobacteriales bacterium]